jgi:hypothetical protein
MRYNVKVQHLSRPLVPVLRHLHAEINDPKGRTRQMYKTRHLAPAVVPYKILLKR